MIYFEALINTQSRLAGAVSRGWSTGKSNAKTGCHCGVGTFGVVEFTAELAPSPDAAVAVVVSESSPLSDSSAVLLSPLSD